MLSKFLPELRNLVWAAIFKSPGLKWSWLVIMGGIVPLALFLFALAFLFRFDFRIFFRTRASSNTNEAGTGGEDERLCRSKDEGEQVTVDALIDTFENALRLEDHSEDLVPGLPNVIILDVIVAKLPWRALHSLSSVSRCWRHATRSRQVYDARVRSHSTETLFAMHHVVDGQFGAISLYSARDDTWHRLPQVPQSPRGVPSSWDCVSLDGKLYLIGDPENGTRGVFVLDLVEQRDWKECASMQEPRVHCKSGVVGGKIYAFGGMSFEGDPISGSEVYDPKENVWASIRPMNAKPLSHTVLTIGEELFVCGGLFWEDSDDFAIMANGPHGPRCYGMFSEVYHPGKDEWRLVTPFGWCDFQSFFMAEGELYGINYMGIRVKDIKAGDNSWRALHSCLFPGIDPTNQARIRVFKAHAVNGEVLALVDDGLPEYIGPSILKSKGFRSGNAYISWENVNCPLSFDCIPFMCPVQL